MEIFGLTTGQLLMLAGLGLILFVILLVLRHVLKLTKTCLSLGCLGIFILLLIVGALFTLQTPTG